jgi:tRNA dimethylallyltransferase
MNDHIIVILGPTATGKSDLAVKIAQNFNGEIISADSRQIYKGLDIGTGKITKDEMRGIKHYCLDIADTNRRFTVVDWMTEAKKAIKEIQAKEKIPIICGGTGFYIDSLIHNYIYPELKSEHENLEKQSTNDLFEILNRLDPDYANKIDRNNRRKIEKAIVLAKEYGKVPEIKYSPSLGKFILIGIDIPMHELSERIEKRLLKRIDQGMIEEAKKLYSNGISYEKMEELGLEYRYMSRLLRENMTMNDFLNILKTKIRQYAKRQMTWFKKMKNIKWFGNPQVENNMNDIIDYVKDKLYE